MRLLTLTLLRALRGGGIVRFSLRNVLWSGVTGGALVHFSSIAADHLLVLYSC